MMIVLVFLDTVLQERDEEGKTNYSQMGYSLKNKKHMAKSYLENVPLSVDYKQIHKSFFIWVTLKNIHVLYWQGIFIS